MSQTTAAVLLSTHVNMLTLAEWLDKHCYFVEPCEVIKFFDGDPTRHNRLYDLMRLHMVSENDKLCDFIVEEALHDDRHMATSFEYFSTNTSNFYSVEQQSDGTWEWANTEGGKYGTAPDADAAVEAILASEKPE